MDIKWKWIILPLLFMLAWDSSIHTGHFVPDGDTDDDEPPPGLWLSANLFIYLGSLAEWMEIQVHAYLSTFCKCFRSQLFNFRHKSHPPNMCKIELKLIHSFRGCSQMTSALFGVSDTPWCLCQPIISFWPAPWCFKLTTSFVNCPEPVVGARVCTQMTIIENSQSTIHLLQKGSSWAYWDPLRPSLDGFHRIVGFFVIHQLFL